MGHADLVPVEIDNEALGPVVVAPRDVIRDAWLRAQRSPHTKAAYRSDTDEYFAWCDQLGVDVLTASRQIIDTYRGWLGDVDTVRPAGRCQPATVARKLTSLSSFYRYGADEAPRYVPASPVARVHRPEVSEDTLTEGLSKEEARQVVAAARDVGPMEHALLLLMLSTGIRVSEACSATTTDLGWSRGSRTLIVTRKGGKRQALPLPPECADALRAYLGGRTGPLFLSRSTVLSRRQAGRIVKRLAVRTLGPEAGTKISPHGLRHTAATMALDGDPERGVKPASLRHVQQMLGHRDPRTTNRYDRARGNLDASPVHGLGRMLTTSQEEANA